MQVNTITDHVTHAVIGNNKAREAQISNSAEFFNVLSNTLYSDKKLAVVREVLCNAWDMHIQQGITDTPVEVTLRDGKLTIRDFGTGIHDDHIVDVYLTYGNSTKKLDGSQTGGFGLGSKAPWAYVDHFEVTSYHAGTMTIYNLSKSSGEVAGKPSATTMVSVPTTETGLQVSMAVQGTDMMAFSSIIQMIAQFGEMNVSLNGDLLKTLPFSQAKHGFMILKHDFFNKVPESNSASVYIRYGNVVYPLPQNEKINGLIRDVNEILNYAGRNIAYKIVLQAKPNTISVTPSRETLSMTDHTIKHVKELLEDFIALHKSKFESTIFDTARNAVSEIWVKGRPADLLTSDNIIPGVHKTRYGQTIYIGDYQTKKDQITDIESISNQYLTDNYPSFNGFRQKDILTRLNAMEQSGFGNRGKIQSFRKEYLIEKEIGHGSRYDRRSGERVSDWFQRTLVAPILKKMAEEPEMNPTKFCVYGMQVTPPRRNQYSSSVKEDAVTEASKLSPRSLIRYIPFLRNFVVLAYNRMDVIDRLRNRPAMEHWFGSPLESFVYIVPRTAGKADIAREFFQKLGMYVVDLTKPASWETVQELAPVPKAPAKPRKKGLPVVSAILTDHSVDLDRIKKDEDIKRIEKPEFVVLLNARNHFYDVVAALDRTWCRIAIGMFADKGGVVVNENQLNKFKDMGIPTFNDYFTKYLLEEIKTNPRLPSYLRMKTDLLPTVLKDVLDRDAKRLLDIILRKPLLAKEFNLTHEATANDILLYQIFEEFVDHYTYRRCDMHKTTTDMVAELQTLKPNPVLLDLAHKLSKSKNYAIIDRDVLKGAFSDDQDNTASTARKKQRQTIIDVLHYVIEG